MPRASQPRLSDIQSSPSNPGLSRSNAVLIVPNRSPPTAAASAAGSSSTRSCSAIEAITSSADWARLTTLLSTWCAASSPLIDHTSWEVQPRPSEKVCASCSVQTCAARRRRPTRRRPAARAVPSPPAPRPHRLASAPRPGVLRHVGEHRHALDRELQRRDARLGAEVALAPPQVEVPGVVAVDVVGDPGLARDVGVRQPRLEQQVAQAGVASRPDRDRARQEGGEVPEERNRARRTRLPAAGRRHAALAARILGQRLQLLLGRLEPVGRHHPRVGRAEHVEVRLRSEQRGEVLGELEHGAGSFSHFLPRRRAMGTDAREYPTTFFTSPASLLRRTTPRGPRKSMTEIEIGRAKRARRAHSFDDVAIVPSRRTRDPEEVSVDWQIDAYRFELPVLAAPMDSVMSPAQAIALGWFRRPGRAQPRGALDSLRGPDPDAGRGLGAPR